MFDFLKGKPDKLIGVDIGTKNIKIVELEKESETKAKLKNYTMGSLQEASARKMSAKSLGDLLKKLLAKANIETKEAVMSLPAYSSFMPTVDFESEMDDKEVEKTLDFQAQKYIPIPLEEVTLGWHRLSKTEILLIAVPKKLTNRYVQIAQKIGLELSSLEGETLALSRALVDPTAKRVVIIDFGARSTNLALVENSIVRLNQTIEVQNFEASEKISLVEKPIRQLVDSYGKIETIICTGGTDLTRVKKVLASHLDMKVQTANPWREIVYEKDYQKKLKKPLKELSAYLGVAVGLALKVREE